MFPTKTGRLSGRWRVILACAYELTEDEVAHDAVRVWNCVGSDDYLIAAIEQRHGWSPDSKLGPYFLAALRRALA